MHAKLESQAQSLPFISSLLSVASKPDLSILPLQQIVAYHTKWDLVGLHIRREQLAICNVGQDTGSFIYHTPCGIRQTESLLLPFYHLYLIVLSSCLTASLWHSTRKLSRKKKNKIENISSYEMKRAKWYILEYFMAFLSCINPNFNDQNKI